MGNEEAKGLTEKMLTSFIDMLNLKMFLDIWAFMFKRWM